MSATRRSIAGIISAVMVLGVAACQGATGSASHDANTSQDASAQRAGAPPNTAQTSTPSTVDGSSAASAAAALAEGHGLVRGTVMRPPGVDPRSGGGGGSSVPVNGDPVRVFDQQGKQVATAVSGIGGGFQFTLPAGRYRLAEDICRATQQVDITSRTATTVTLMLPDGC